MGPFTNVEYCKVKENLIDGKAARPVGIAPEILNRLSKILMLEFSKKILTRYEIPSQCLECNIVPFPKSGNLKEAWNYRGIALSLI